MPKVVLDKAYRRDDICHPLFTSEELSLLVGLELQLIIQYNKENTPNRMYVKSSFNDYIHKFLYSDYYIKHRLLQNGHLNFKQL